MRGPSLLMRSCTTFAPNSALPARSFQLGQSKLARTADDFRSEPETRRPRTAYSSRCKLRANHGLFTRGQSYGDRGQRVSVDPASGRDVGVD